MLTQLVGESLAHELDKMVAIGSGTNQPEGVVNKIGLNLVTPANGTAGPPPTLTDYYTMLFSLPKQYRNRKNNVVWISNDTTYQRSRTIMVNTGWNLPAFDVLNQAAANEYTTIGWPHKIQNDIGNSTCVFADMSRFRMYRRIGLEIRFTSRRSDLGPGQQRVNGVPCEVRRSTYRQ